MVRGIATARNIKQRRRGDHMKTLEMELKSEEQKAGKRSHRKQGRKKKFPFSSREIARLGPFGGQLQAKGGSPRDAGKKLRQRQARLRIEQMEIELENMKVQISDSAESLIAANVEVNQAEAKLEELTTTRDNLMDNLSEMKAAEAFLMGFI